MVAPLIGQDEEKISKHSTEKLLEFVNGWGIELDLSIFERVIQESYTIFGFCDLFEELTGKPVPDEYSDNFLTVIRVLWKRLYPEKFCIDLLIRDLPEIHTSEDPNENLPAERLDEFITTWNNMIKLVKDDPSGHLKYVILTHYETKIWIFDLIEKLQYHAEQKDCFQFLEKAVSDYQTHFCSDEPDANLCHFQVRLAEAYWRTGNSELANQLFAEVETNYPDFKQVYLRWFHLKFEEYLATGDTISENDKIHLEHLLQKAKEIELQTDEKSDLHYIYNLMETYYEHTDQVEKLKATEELKEELPSDNDPEPQQPEISGTNETDSDNLDLSFMVQEPEKDIFCRFICFDCGFGFTDEVEKVYVEDNYLRTDEFYENKKPDNGKIMFDTEIRCPTCQSNKFMVEHMTKMGIITNIVHEQRNNVKKRRFHNLNLSFAGRDISSLREALQGIKMEYENDPDNPDILNRAGIVYQKYNYYHHAKNVLKKSIMIEKNNPQAYFELGKIYHGRRRYKKAKHCFFKMKKLQPKMWENVKDKTTSKISQFVEKHVM